MIAHSAEIPSASSKETYVKWFKWLQTHICEMLEQIEKDYSTSHSVMETGREAKVFKRKSWRREDPKRPHDDGGGGTMSILDDGVVFERAGVNISEVFGTFPEAFAKEIPGTEENTQFWAAGISLVIHPRNPFVPIVHMNTRHIITSRSWFGGGADLTPCLPFEEDTAMFHQAMKEACDAYSPNAYKEYKQWCDEYFYIPHRKEPRGVGGIFFDYLNSGNSDADFEFLQNVGKAFAKTYEEIVRRRMYMTFGEAEKEIQLIKRGRYAEFNLVYDRGTRFGLMTHGNTEAILMSLPPFAKWKAPCL